MATQEISALDWARFCERFDQLFQGALLSIDHQNPNGYKLAVVHETPLQRVLFDRDDACNNRIRFVLGGAGERERVHEIIEPIHLKLRQDNRSRKILEIDAENGITFVSFHTGKIHEVLQGLKLL